jgi:hypothetical protein
MIPMGWVESRIPSETNFRFNHHYDIRSENYDDYLNFIKKEYIPNMEKQGIKMIGGWELAIGPGPNIIMESSCASVKQILNTIGSPEYGSLTTKLLDMVCNFGSKILVPTGLVP